MTLPSPGHRWVPAKLKDSLWGTLSSENRNLCGNPPPVVGSERNWGPTESVSPTWWQCEVRATSLGSQGLGQARVQLNAVMLNWREGQVWALVLKVVTWEGSPALWGWGVGEGKRRKWSFVSRIMQCILRMFYVTVYLFLLPEPVCFLL